MIITPCFLKTIHREQVVVEMRMVVLELWILDRRVYLLTCSVVSDPS